MSLATLTTLGFAFSEAPLDVGYGFPSSRRKSTDFLCSAGLCGIGACTGALDVRWWMGSGSSTGDTGEKGVTSEGLETGPGLKLGEKGFVSGNGSWYELGSTAVVTGTGGCVFCRRLS